MTYATPCKRQKTVDDAATAMPTVAPADHHRLHGKLLEIVASYLAPLDLVAAAGTAKEVYQAFTSPAAWYESRWHLSWEWAETLSDLCNPKSHWYIGTQQLNSLRRLQHIEFEKANLLFEADIDFWHNMYGQFLSNLPVMSALRSLTNVYAITDEQLAKFTRLETLVLRQTKLTDALFTALSRLPHLHDLQMVGECDFEYETDMLVRGLGLLSHMQLHMHIFLRLWHRTQTLYQISMGVDELRELLDATHLLTSCKLELLLEAIEKVTVEYPLHMIRPAQSSRLRTLTIKFVTCFEENRSPDMSYVDAILQLLTFYPALTHVHVSKLTLTDDDASKLLLACRERHIELTTSAGIVKQVKNQPSASK